MAKPTVWGTGLSGLVGSRVVALLTQFDWINLDSTTGADITRPETLLAATAELDQPLALLHCAAFTNVEQAHQENGDKNGMTYQVNVEGTKNVAQFCAQRGIYLIHLSTAYVFDGQKQEPYSEVDPTNPTDWYSQTKLWAEEAVQKYAPHSSILRINFPTRTDEFPRPDLRSKIRARLQSGSRGPFFADHFFTLTSLEWFAQVIAWAIEDQPHGIFHATDDRVWTDLDLAKEEAAKLGITDELQGSSVTEFNQTATRIYQPSLVLDSSKLRNAMKKP